MTYDYMHNFYFGLIVSIAKYIPVFHLQLCNGELLLIFSLKNISIKNFQDASSVLALHFD